MANGEIGGLKHGIDGEQLALRRLVVERPNSSAVIEQNRGAEELVFQHRNPEGLGSAFASKVVLHRVRKASVGEVAADSIAQVSACLLRDAILRTQGGLVLVRRIWGSGLSGSKRAAGIVSVERLNVATAFGDSAFARGGGKSGEIGRFEKRMAKGVHVLALGTKRLGGGLRFDAVFHAVALALDDDGLGVVQEAVEHGGGDGGVAVEDGGPVLEGFVGGQDDGTAFVALADDLEEEVRAALVDGQVADFVEQQ